MKKKVLIHSIAFSPDGVSTAYLYNDIALGLTKHGFEVVVLTTTPHYNRVDEELAKQPLKRHFLGLYYTSRFNDICIYHVPQKKFESTALRILGFIYWHLVSLIIGLCLKSISVVLSPSPPLTIGLISLVIGKLKGSKVIYNVQEIYPDFLINQGSLKSNWMIRVLRWLESTVYNYSDATTTIDQIFHANIVSRFENPSKLHVIPNFVDTSIYRSVDRDSSLDTSSFPDTNTLKLMYAGNIGYAQDWNPLLDIAERVRSELIEFWVVGEGVLKPSLIEEVEKRNLKNIHILPYQPRRNMPSLIAYADLHFIFMNSAMEREGFPSKVYTLMACKKPLLVITGHDTPLYNFLKPNNCAFFIKSKTTKGKVNELEEKLREIITNRGLLQAFGENGYDIVRSRYSKDAVIKQYVALIEGLIAR